MRPAQDKVYYFLWILISFSSHASQISVQFHPNCTWPLCVGLNENGPSRLIGSETLRRYFLVGVGVTMSEEVCQ